MSSETRAPWLPINAGRCNVPAGRPPRRVWLARWDAWDHAKVIDQEPVELDDEMPQAGESRTVTVEAELGGLTADDVLVQCVHGRVGHDGEFGRTHVVPLEMTAPGTYAGTITIAAAGTHGVTARVIPVHPDLASPFDVGRVAWAG